MELLAELHPRIVHFPIAFLFIYPIVELISYITRSEFFKKAAMLFLFIGVVTSLAAVLSGNQAFQLVGDFSASKKNLFDSHELYANLTMWLFTIVLIARFYLDRKNMFTRVVQFVIIIIGMIGMIFIFQAGNYGAKFADVNSKKAISSETL